MGRAFLYGIGGGIKAKPEQEQNIVITKNGAVSAVPDEGHVLSRVDIDVNVQPNTEPITITENGVYKASETGGGHKETFVYDGSKDSDKLKELVPGSEMYGLEIPNAVPVVPIIDGVPDISVIRTGWTLIDTNGSEPLTIRAEDLPYYFPDPQYYIDLEFNDGLIALILHNGGQQPMMFFVPVNFVEILVSFGVPQSEVERFASILTPGSAYIIAADPTDTNTVVTFEYTTVGEAIDGFSEVTVNVPVPEGELVITEDGTYDVTQYSSVVVDVIDTEPGEDFDGTIVISGEAQEEDELAGTWVFNDYPSFTETGIHYDVNFTSNENTYTRMGHDEDSGGLGMVALYYDSTEVFNPDAGGEWTNEAYKIININSKLSEVTNGDTLLTWLKANATKQESEVVEYYTTSITYNSLTTRIDAAGQKTTLGMKGLKATSDIEIGFGSKGFVIYNGQTTSVKAGQTATLICAGKQLVDDVIIDTTSIRYTVEITESGSMLVLDGHTTEENENGTTVVLE